MQIKTKGWTPERRAKQAENIRKTKPWKTASGPKTPEGKAISSQNSLKHGLRSAEILELKRVLHAQRQMLKTLWGQ